VTTLAIDIGGTKLAAGMVDGRGVLHRRRHVPNPRGVNGEELFSALAELVAEVVDGTSPERCGVGCGGPMTAGGETVSPLNIPAWRDFPLLDRLRSVLGVPVHVDNDAKALALAEGWQGTARGVSDYLAMVVSTGVGAGIVSGGRLLQGASGNAGHLGHVYVAEDSEPWPGHPAGLLETEASGTAIAVRTGAPASEAGRDVVRRTGVLVGRAVASAANLLDLRLAVVAGSVALGFGRPFFVAAQAEIDRLCVLDFSVGARIVPAGLGDAGPLIGAAAVALRAEGADVGVS
jgi:glucokinase